MNSGNSANNPLINVAKPTRHSFMNFTQHFRSKYEGEPKTTTEFAVMAGEAWRNMSDQEKAPYIALANAEKQKLKAASVVEPKKSKRLALKELKTMTTKFTQLEKVVKRLQAHPKHAPRQRVALPPQRRMVQRPTGRKVAHKSVHKVARKAAQKPVSKVAHKHAARGPRRVAHICSSDYFSDSSY